MTNITIKDADYSANAIGFALPVDGAVYGNFFGTGYSMTRNLMNPLAPGVLVGTPTLVTEGMQCNGASAHVISPIIPAVASAFTIVAAYSWDDVTSAAPVVSNYSNDASGIAMLARRLTSSNSVYTMSGVAAVSDGVTNTDANGPNSPEVEPVGSVAIAGLSYDPAQTIYARMRVHAPIRGFASSTLQGSPTFTQYNSFASNALRIGAHRGGTLNTANTIRSAWIFDRALTDSEVVVMGQFLAGYYQRRGFST